MITKFNAKTVFELQIDENYHPVLLNTESGESETFKTFQERTNRIEQLLKSLE